MLADYFTEDELIKKIGVSKSCWYDVVVKELIDNALDAIEPLKEKIVSVEVKWCSFSVFDNGAGISVDTIKRIYDFSVYVSKNRDYITASRGKQGNGLKTIIGICYLSGYKLLWHTKDGVILEPVINAELAKDGIINVEYVEHGSTDKRGVEILGVRLKHSSYYTDYVYYYTKCNPDVNFYLDYLDEHYYNKASKDPVDKSNNISLAFYDYGTYRRFIRGHDGNLTYKQFLKEYFGTRISNKSRYKCKIAEIDFASKDFIEDFIELKMLQTNKKYTLLKEHLIGLENRMETNIEIKRDNNTCNIVNDTYIPCIVEFDIEKLSLKNKSKNSKADIECYVNNSITYFNGDSVCFDSADYSIGQRKIFGNSLQDLFADMSNFRFVFHIVSPYLVFKDAGKTQIDITSFIGELLEKVNKSISKANREFSADSQPKESNRSLMRKYLTEAFNLASNNGQYAITARQIWYKMRELSGIEEGNSTYSDFTQTILTEWLDEHTEYEDKVNFSDRGNFYVDGVQIGLGTANVRRFINKIGTETNTFRCYGGISSEMYVKADFGLEYSHDKVLFIEKTGFDAIFQAENIEQKYNMVIVSGQGFSTRAAKTLLYQLQKMGLKLYCMHDLDISGFYIFNTFTKLNQKFKHPIEIIDLGVTLEDVERYGIQPEYVKAKKEDLQNLKSLPEKYKKFFDAGSFYRRVELNAFTTKQILEILDRKLSLVNNLPTIDLEKSLNVDHDVVKEVAFMRIMEKKYKDSLSDIHVPLDLSTYKGLYTVDMAKKKLPEIEEMLIQKYQNEIEQKLNIA